MHDLSSATAETIKELRKAMFLNDVGYLVMQWAQDDYLECRYVLKELLVKIDEMLKKECKI